VSTRKGGARKPMDHMDNCMLFCVSRKQYKAGFMKGVSVAIPPEEIHYDFIRASGPGGQNVNKVETAVQLRFNPRNSRFIGPEILERLLRLAGNRVNASGEIIIEARRLDRKRRRAQVKKLRGHASIDE
jgi:protein subunit release factor B